LEKRYQVFVSSTYADLKKERQHVIQALMEMDCIPAGMELFPAADEEQWKFIKSVIDDCDYYLLIIGGRYGSTTTEGLSYTEKEFDYAFEKNIKIIALLHENPDDIPVGKSEIDPDLRERLKLFRNKAATNRLVKYWKKAEELPGIVALSLSKTIKMYPAIGWVRANTVANEEILTELNDIRKENNSLKTSLSKIEQKPDNIIEDLAGIDESFTMNGTYFYRGTKTKWSTSLTWKEIFAYIAPYLITSPNDKIVKQKFENTLSEINKIRGTHFHLNDQEFQTISLQLRALNLIYVEYSKSIQGNMALFYSLTKQGNNLMMQLRTVPSKTTLRTKMLEDILSKKK
jgi:hypothetical protein